MVCHWHFNVDIQLFLENRPHAIDSKLIDLSILERNGSKFETGELGASNSVFPPIIDTATPFPVSFRLSSVAISVSVECRCHVRLSLK